MADMRISMALAAKVGSILVHVDEALSARGHPFDVPPDRAVSTAPGAAAGATSEEGDMDLLDQFSVTFLGVWAYDLLQGWVRGWVYERRHRKAWEQAAVGIMVSLDQGAEAYMERRKDGRSIMHRHAPNEPCPDAEKSERLN